MKHILVIFWIALLMMPAMAFDDTFWDHEVEWNLMMADRVMDMSHYTIASGYYEDMSIDDREYLHRVFITCAGYAMYQNSTEMADYCLMVGEKLT